MSEKDSLDGLIRRLNVTTEQLDRMAESVEHHQDIEKANKQPDINPLIRKAQFKALISVGVEISKEATRLLEAIAERIGLEL